MTGRERWLAVLRREKPDRIPMDMWITEEAHQKLKKHLGIFDNEKLNERLHIDRPAFANGVYIGPQHPNGDGDLYGIKHENISYDGGSYNEAVTAPLARFNSVAEIEKEYVWPHPDWWKYDHLPAHAEKYRDRPIQGGGSEPFLLYKLLRGDIQAFIDLVENPEIVHYCLDKLFGVAYENSRRIFEAIPGQVTHCYVAEDLGSQETLMMSKKHISEFLLPRMKRMIDLAHSAGVYAFHHNDGACREIIPDMIEIGIDVLNPIQWRCNGMAREGLKRDFGKKLIFHGGIDNQYTLPFGTVEEVKQEVADNIRILGAGGGYILAPSHNIQAVSPTENIGAMFDTGYELGKT